MTPPGPVTAGSGDEQLDDVQRAALKAFIGANDRSAGLLAAVAAVRPLIEAETRAEIDRLRAQNKASSDAWTRRTAAVQSRIDDHDNTLRWIRSQPEWEYRLGCSSFVQKVLVLAVMEERIAEARAEERARIADEQISNDAAWHSIWLHGHWRYLTSKMTTDEREVAATAIERHFAYAEMPWSIEPSSLRWWLDDARIARGDA